MTEVFLSLLAGAIALVLARDVYRLLRPTVLLQRGRYEEARRAAERLERSWLAVMPSVRSAAAYTVACAEHLRGDLEGSLTTLARLDGVKLDVNLRYATASLRAANLVLTGRDFETAERLLREAMAIRERAEDLLLLAHVVHVRGDAAAGAALLERAATLGARGRVSVGKTILVHDAALESTIFHALRGLYFIRVGRGDLALKDLEVAARGPNGNVYADRARALVPPKGAVDDPRSTLAPQVVDD